MKSILNGVLGQEGNAISVKVKDTFFVTNQPQTRLSRYHRGGQVYADYPLRPVSTTGWKADIFLSYTSFLNYGFVPKFNNKPASIFVAYAPSSRTTGLRPCPTDSRRGGRRAFK